MQTVKKFSFSAPYELTIVAMLVRTKFFKTII